MADQLIALGLALIGAIALAACGIRQRRKIQEATPVGTGVPMFRAFSDEVGRVAEEGRSIHVALGSGDILGEQGMVSIAALQGLTALTELSAAYDTPPLITAGNPTLYLLAENQARGAYARLGSSESYRFGTVRYVAPSPIVYAAMAATLAADESLGTNINLGSFDQEVSLLTHAATVNNVALFGGAASPTGAAALYPELGPTHMAIGEELFAGGAEVTKRSAFWAGLATQDIMRWLVILGMLVAAGASLLGLGG
ncbi:MAG: hypothetical protein JXC32_19155 [Anaerolineae bacterium]|nr:hypothetical protein [Anaerolineae bacterium]